MFSRSVVVWTFFRLIHAYVAKQSHSDCTTMLHFTSTHNMVIHGYSVFAFGYSYQNCHFNLLVGHWLARSLYETLLCENINMWGFFRARVRRNGRQQASKQCMCVRAPTFYGPYVLVSRDSKCMDILSQIPAILRRYTHGVWGQLLACTIQLWNPTDTYRFRVDHCKPYTFLPRELSVYSQESRTPINQYTSLSHQFIGSLFFCVPSTFSEWFYWLK